MPLINTSLAPLFEIAVDLHPKIPPLLLLLLMPWLAQLVLSALTVTVESVVYCTNIDQSVSTTRNAKDRNCLGKFSILYRNKFKNVIS